MPQAQVTPQYNADRPVFPIQTIKRVLQQEFSLELQELRQLDVAQSGDSSAIYLSTHGKQQVVVKIGREPRKFRVEVAGLALLAASNIPAPRTIAHTDNATLINRPVMVQTRAPGEPLSKLLPETDRLAVWEDAGTVLKRMHAIPLDGFGRLDTSDGQLKGEHDHFTPWIQEFLLYIDYVCEHQFITAAKAARIRDVYSEIVTQRQSIGASFLHADLQGPHIFTNGQRVTAFIDIASAMAGDPLYDIAYAHYFMTPEERVSFDRGYGQAATDPLVWKYFLLIAVGKIRYRHRKGFTHRLPSAIEKLAEGLQATGIRD